MDANKRLENWLRADGRRVAKIGVQAAFGIVVTLTDREGNFIARAASEQYEQSRTLAETIHAALNDARAPND